MGGGAMGQRSYNNQNNQHNQTIGTLGKQLAVLSVLTIVSAWLLEHSQLDLHISALFYHQGQWLLQKDAQPYAFIFYDFPKALLILFGVYLLGVLLLRYRRRNNTVAPSALSTPLRAATLSTYGAWLCQHLPSRELLYLLLTLIIVPTIIASLKSVTHVSCPNHLSFFNGDLPYLDIWQNMLAKTPAKCFPAAHASAGFALYGFAYLPSLRRHRLKVIMIATTLGWSMGLYKMLIGDHFFSHTVVSMLLSWTIACAIAILFFRKKAPRKAVISQYQHVAH